ncbi:MAG: hypothetical protein GXP62_05130 [Oligoflexia bacterium]|nr:hypothetical protein [Oligoflexia bacterium]
MPVHRPHPPQLAAQLLRAGATRALPHRQPPGILKAADSGVPVPEGFAHSGGPPNQEISSSKGQPTFRIRGIWTADPLPLPEGSGELRKVLVFSANDAIAVDNSETDGDRLLHFDGETWTVLDALAGDLVLRAPAWNDLGVPAASMPAMLSPGHRLHLSP